MVQFVPETTRSASAVAKQPALPARLIPLTLERSVSATSSARLRAALIGACVFCVAVAAYMGDPTGYLQADPALAHLLRCMALIKGAIVVAAVSAAIWRLGWSVSRPAALTYVLGCAALAGSAMLIWQLTLIPVAALLFHGAAVCMVIIGWRER